MNLNDIRDETFSFEENTFKFGGVGGNEQRRYEVEMEFYKEILPQVCLLRARFYLDFCKRRR